MIKKIKIEKPRVNARGETIVCSSFDVDTRFVVNGVVFITDLKDLQSVIDSLIKIKERLEKRQSKIKLKNKKK